MTTSPTLAPIVEITPRQNDVLQELLKDGADNDTIARRLKICRNSVKTHVRALLRHTHTSNRAALVVEVLKGRVQIEVVDRNAPL